MLWMIPGFAWLFEALQTPAVTANFAMPQGPTDWCLLAVMSVANGFAEQAVLCALLLPRLLRVVGHRGQAVAIMTICFVSYHIYQGWVVVLLLLPMGLIFGWYFLWRRRLWPLALAHASFDFTAYAAA